ncbi:MAG: hypothetical protein NC929_04305, partial [Candidatus Omnitrophica bacterium]|nr:hypothetical protein [Candidatus Omnitrophota bacterium]
LNYRQEKRVYFNVVNQMNEFGVLAVPLTAYKMILSLLVDYKQKYNIDMTGTNGVFINIIKQQEKRGDKNVIYRVEAVHEMIDGNSLKLKTHTLTPELLDLAEKQAYDLNSLFKELDEFCIGAEQNDDRSIVVCDITEDFFDYKTDTDIIEEEKGLKCLKKIMSPDFICCRTSGGLDLSALPVFLLKAGRTGEALEYYLDRWGEPIKNGATTCGEEFFQTDGNSDCHIHGAAPARDLIEYLAGIRIAAPGWKKVIFVPPAYTPELPELYAAVPTLYGSIEVEIKKVNGRIIYRYDCPDGIKHSVKNRWHAKILNGKTMEGEDEN